MSKDLASLTHKEYSLEKYRSYPVPELINRKLIIHKQLERPPRTYVVYSDLHGSSEKFLHWLKNGMGYYKIAVERTLGKSYSTGICESYEMLLYAVNRKRIDALEKFVESDQDNFDEQHHFFEGVTPQFRLSMENLVGAGLSRQRILMDCIDLLRETTGGDERRIIKAVPPEWVENIMKLYHRETDEEGFRGLVNGVVSSGEVFDFVISLVLRLTVSNMFDKHINLGDTYDRGDGADKLVKLYRNYFGDDASGNFLHYIWGNHDILWLGAAIGNPISCIEALRISMRYNNTSFLDRYGFDLSGLREYALKTYKEMPTGKYIKSSNFPTEEVEAAAKMTKALLVMQFKVTLQMLEEAAAIPGDIDYTVELERHRRLLKLLPVDIEGQPEKWKAFMEDHPLYTDVYFPSLDAANPQKLSPEEKDLVDDLVMQFTTLPALQRDLVWMFEKGETYRVVDNTLFFHAALPSTDDKELKSIKGRTGRKMLDFIQRDLKRICTSHKAGREVTLREKMLLWHLWCGSESPFFCKSKMATLERAVFEKEFASRDPLTTWREVSNPFYKNVRDDGFLHKILREFHAGGICMGHTPVSNIDKAVLSESVRAFLIDGGASAAYGDKGAVLINAPDCCYVTLNPPLEDLIRAEDEGRLPDFKCKPIQDRHSRRLGDMDKGFFLKEELAAIEEILESKTGSFFKKYFHEK